MDKRRILIVDDLEMNRVMLKKEFMDTYDVKEASDGNSALEVLERFSVDLVITDIFMDGMDGYELIRSIRKQKETKKLPIIAITENDKASHERAILAGADDFLSRPFYKESVREMIEKILTRRRNSYQLINMEYLLNTIPGGVIVYKLEEQGVKMNYVSQGVADLFGITLEEFYVLTQKVPFAGIYESDTERVKEAFEHSRVTGEDLDVTYRIYYRHERFVWIRMQGRIVGEEDGCPLLHAIFLNESKETELYTNILDEAKVIVFVIDEETHEILYENRIAKEWNRNRSFPPREETTEKLKKKEYEVTEFELGQETYRLICKKINWNSRAAIIQYIEDITKDRQNQIYAEEAEESMRKTIANLSVGIIVYQLCENKRWRIVEISPLMCQLVGVSPEKVIGLEGEDMLQLVHKEDLGNIHKVEKRLLNPQNEIIEIFRNYNAKEQEYKWLYMRGRSAVEANGSLLAYMTYSDITDQMVLDEKLSESEQSLKAAVENNHLFYWEVDLSTSAVKCDERFSAMYGIGQEGQNYPEFFLSGNYILEEDKETYRQNVIQAMKHCENTSFECRCRNTKTGKYDWCRINLTVLVDKNHVPVRLVGTSQDISDEKDTEQRYLEEVEYQKGIMNNLIGSCRMNLTQNKLDDFWIGDQINEAAINQNLNDFQSRIEFTLKEIHLSAEDYKQFTNTELIEKYNEGIRSIEKTFLARKKNDESVCWINTRIKLLASPISSDILAFFYTRDVTGDVMSRMISEMVTKNYYEVAGYIELSNRHFHIDAYNWKADIPKAAFPDYDTALNQFIQKRVSKEEQEEVTKAQSLDYVIHQLESQKIYSSQYRYLDNKGVKHVKETQFFYGEESKDFIIVSRRDITDIIIESERKHEELEKALAEAKRANIAKSDFLSRMSHDMRTPMNAIIGLTTLMLDEDKIPEEIRDSLEKIRTSSDFLLGLVNDVLDMAKIEEGSITLHKEEYDYGEFIDSFISMFETQCKEKGIHLNIERPSKNYTIYGDKLRINQIFFNMMSNAVKFTPKGGEIRYWTENLGIANSMLTSDFIIEDTGVGMSKEFQKYMFEPFVQEDHSITTNYQGSGLGLSIAKILTERMGGTLQIESEPGKGTRATIHLPFEVKGESTTPQANEDEKQQGNVIKNAKDQEPINVLAEKRILLVEDHPLNAEIAKRLLEKKQILVEHAINGELAVDDFRNSSIHYYDAILMDIRMPVMDGITATRMIRQMDREDAKEVPIIAMTANAYEEDIQKTKEAGMNEHLSKPVDPQLLFDTLERFITGQ